MTKAIETSKRREDSGRKDQATSVSRPARFATVVLDYQGPLLRYAQRLLRDHDAAQDVVQETFIRYLKNPPEPRVDQPGATKNWLYRVARNLCVDLIRKETRIREKAREYEAPENDRTPLRELEMQESRARVERLLDKLSKNQNRTLRLRICEGKSYREISEITGLTVSNVGFHIHQGLRRTATLIKAGEGER